MARVVLIKDPSGDLRGLSNADERAYIRFASHVDEMAVGETLAFSWTEPRSPEFHRAHFALLKLVFDSQEAFSDPESLRLWLEVGAGHCDFLPGPTGELVAIARSIAYEKLDETPFRDHHRKVIDFLRTPAAYGVLWPHLSAADGEAAIDNLLAAYESREQSETLSPAPEEPPTN